MKHSREGRKDKKMYKIQILALDFKHTLSQNPHKELFKKFVKSKRSYYLLLISRDIQGEWDRGRCPIGGQLN